MSNHYNISYKGLRLDPYRISVLYGIEHPAHQHALKKLLRAGRGPHKDLRNEIHEIQETLNRWLNMIDEDTPETLDDEYLY